MIRIAFFLPLVILSAACTLGENARTQVIVGATLVDGNNPPVPYSVVIVREGKISAVGTQQDTPIPADSEKMNGLGKWLVSAQHGGRIQPGMDANLLLLDSDPAGHPEAFEKPLRRMRNGKWNT